MTEKQSLQSAADAVLSKDITFEVQVLHPTFFQKWKKETKKEFKISPSTLGTMLKISKEFTDIDLGKFDKTEILNSSFELVKNHAERMALIVAYAVVNSKEDPPQSLVSFLLNNLTAKELSKLVAIVINQIDTVNFLTSIISAKGINLLSRMNPTDEGSILAPGKQ